MRIEKVTEPCIACGSYWIINRGGRDAETQCADCADRRRDPGPDQGVCALSDDDHEELARLKAESD